MLRPRCAKLQFPLASAEGRPVAFVGYHHYLLSHHNQDKVWGRRRGKVWNTHRPTCVNFPRTKDKSSVNNRNFQTGRYCCRTGKSGGVWRSTCTTLSSDFFVGPSICHKTEKKISLLKMYTSKCASALFFEAPMGCGCGGCIWRRGLKLFMRYDDIKRSINLAYLVMMAPKLAIHPK